MLILSTLLFGLWLATLCTAQCNQLVPVTECVCPGQSVIYECSVMGGSFTVYNGTAFQCPGGSITLRNNEFGTANSIGVCNSGQISITGRGLMEVNNCYISQVSISLGEVVSQSTLSCAVDGLQLEVVDTAVIALSTGAFSPPSGLSLADASPSYLTFNWTSVFRNCPSLVYNIMATNCGKCPDRTSGTSISCMNFSTSLTCVLSIQTVICNGTSTPIAGNQTTMSYTLKVPSAPSMSVIPHYDDDSNRLIGFNATVTLSDPNPIFVYDFVDGSARSFTLNVSDGSFCDSATTITISPDYCNITNGICRHYYEDLCSTISSRTTIAVYISNVLGNGSRYTTTVDNRNDFVTVEFNLVDNLRTVSCTFHNPRQNDQRMCKISIGSSQRTRIGVRTSEDTETIILDGFLEGTDAFPYSITASDGTDQVVVQGVHNPERTQTTDDVIGGAVAASIILTALLVGGIPVLFFLGHRLYNYLTEREPKRKLLNGRLGVEEHSIRLEELEEDKKMEDAWKEYGNNEQTPAIGHGYREAKAYEEVSPSGKVVVKDKDGNFYAITDIDVALRFMNEHRQVHSVKKRKRGYKDYSLFVEEKSSTVVLREGSEFLYCRNDRAQNNFLQKIQPKLPPGVIEANHWFEVVPVESATFLFEKSHAHGQDLEKSESSDQLIVFFSYESAPRNMTVDSLKKHNRRVMAMSNNHQLYEDSDKVLAQGVLKDQTLPRKWKNVYFEQRGELRLEANSELLFYNPNLERVREPFEMYIVIHPEVEILSYIEEKRNERCNLKHIYEQCDSNQVQDGVRFMALDEKGNLCTGSRKVDAIKKSYKWKSVFTQVKDAGSKAPRNTLLFFCAHEPST